MKKKYICLFAMCLMAASLTGCESIGDEVSNVVSTVREQLGQSETEEEGLQEGQRYANIQVVSITGNELTYVELEEETEEESESETEDVTEEAAEDTAGEESAEAVENAAGEESAEALENAAGEESEEAAEDTAGEESEEAAEEAAENTAGDASEDETDSETVDVTEDETNAEVEAAGSSGTMPDMSSMPDMGDMDMSDFNMEDFDMGDVDMSSFADMFSGSGTVSDNSSEEGDSADAADSSDSSYAAADFSDFDFGGTAQETVTVYLQVGVTVHTGSDSEKTFSILEEGDELKVLFETDDDGNEVITEMWLTSTQ